MVVDAGSLALWPVAVPLAAAALVVERRDPAVSVAPGRDDACAGQHRGAALLGVAGVERNEAGVLHPAVRVLEGAGEAGLQGTPGRVRPEVHAGAAAVGLDAGDAVVARALHHREAVRDLHDVLPPAMLHVGDPRHAPSPWSRARTL